eukprot:5085840-Pyramimonas_sp.AAC.1
MKRSLKQILASDSATDHAVVDSSPCVDLVPPGVRRRLGGHEQIELEAKHSSIGDGSRALPLNETLKR